jgi:hypothetical protein
MAVAIVIAPVNDKVAATIAAPRIPLMRTPPPINFIEIDNVRCLLEFRDLP